KPEANDWKLLVSDGEFCLFIQCGGIRCGRRLDQLDVQAERLQFADKNVERLRHAGFDRGLTLDDGLVNLGTAKHIVRLRGEQLLQDVRSAICFQRPDFHFAEALSAELRLTTQWLLGDEAVWPDRPGMDL